MGHALCHWGQNQGIRGDRTENPWKKGRHQKEGAFPSSRFSQGMAEAAAAKVSLQSLSETYEQGQAALPDLGSSPFPLGPAEGGQGDTALQQQKSPNISPTSVWCCREKHQEENTTAGEGITSAACMRAFSGLIWDPTLALLSQSPQLMGRALPFAPSLAAPNHNCCA